MTLTNQCCSSLEWASQAGENSNSSSRTQHYNSSEERKKERVGVRRPSERLSIIEKASLNKTEKGSE